MLIKETKVNQLHLTQDENKLPKIDIKSSYLHKWKKPFESSHPDNVQDFDRLVELFTSDKFDAENCLEEYSWMVCMKTHGELIGVYELGHGGLTSCVMDPREILMKATLVGSSKIVLVHNHPSGSPKPSKADKEITINIKTLVEPYGIFLYDHIIIGMDGVVSLFKPTKEDREYGNKVIHSVDFYDDDIASEK